MISYTLKGFLKHTVEFPYLPPDEHSVRMEPGLKEVYSNLGRLLAYTGRLGGALRYLDKALELECWSGTY